MVIKRFVPTILMILSLASVTRAEWPMAGHDQERTSWSREDTSPAAVAPIWSKQIKPYIPSESQLITVAARGTIPDLVLVATSAGLYALRADNGEVYWYYATEMPVGNSPTVANGVAYIPCFDKTIHAVALSTGQKIWQTKFAGAGFDTNPLVLDWGNGGMVCTGCRDGYFYCFKAGDGSLYKYFKADGPISNSAAYKDGIFYFGSNYSTAYALRADSWTLAWDPLKLPGEGFYSYWPVIAGDKVIFPGSSVYMNLINTYFTIGTNDILPLPPNSKPGGTDPDINGWHDAKSVSDYFAQRPQRRTIFILDRLSGKEVTPYAPVIYKGNSSGVRYPPAVGPENILYFNAPHTNTGGNWLQGDFLAWQPDTTLIKPVGRSDANDELDALALAGSLMYWNHKEDQIGGAIDIGGISRDHPGYDMELGVWWWHELKELFPNYYESWENRKYGSIANNGYGTHGYSNAPVPLNGKIYFHRSNSIMCFGPQN